MPSGRCWPPQGWEGYLECVLGEATDHGVATRDFARSRGCASISTREDGGSKKQRLREGKSGVGVLQFWTSPSALALLVPSIGFMSGGGLCSGGSYGLGRRGTNNHIQNIKPVVTKHAALLIEPFGSYTVNWQKNHRHAVSGVLIWRPLRNMLGVSLL